MNFYKTMEEFKNWLEHFRIYDTGMPSIEIERYKGNIGRMKLIRSGQTSAFCMSKEYTIKAINKFIAEYLKENKELPY